MGSYNEIMPDVIAIVRECGQYLRVSSCRIGELAVHRKADGSSVSEADMQVNLQLSTRLNKLLPGVPVLSEEDDIAPWTVRQSWQRYWLLDPLDGTSAFLQGETDYCINVALIEQHKPVLGVIYGPHEDKCYYASHSAGAFQYCDDRAMPLASAQLQDEVMLVMSRRESAKIAQSVLTSSGYSCKVDVSSSALKFAMVASGLADGYLRMGQTSHWDTAAGQCLLEQAGGVVCDVQGRALQYNKTAGLNNPGFIAMADASQLSLFQSVLAEYGRITGE